MVSGRRAAHLRPQAARCAQYNARTRRLALSGEDCRARAIKDCCAMPHNRPSTIDSCAMPGTIKGGFATPQIAQHHGIRARVTQLPSRTTNRKEDEMFRARPRYRPLLFRRKRTPAQGETISCRCARKKIKPGRKDPAFERNPDRQCAGSWQPASRLATEPANPRQSIWRR